MTIRCHKVLLCKSKRYRSHTLLHLTAAGHCSVVHCYSETVDNTVKDDFWSFFKVKSFFCNMAIYSPF